MIDAAADEVILCRLLVGEPGYNNALATTICANRIAIRDAVNYWSEFGAKIKDIHT